MLSFRMFADVASLYLDNHNVYNSSSDVEDVLKSTSKLNEVRCSLSSLEFFCMEEFFIVINYCTFLF